MQGKTMLPKFYEQVCEQEQKHYDKVMSAKCLRFGSLGRIAVEGVTMKLQQQCSELICHQIKVPYSYLARCSHDLQAENLNYWFEKFDSKELLLRFDGDEVRAIVTPRYKPIANSTILETFLQNEYTGEVSFALDPKMMKVDIPDYHSSFRIDGEVHKGGISIINGETSWYAFSIQAFILRLVCSNGMISEVREEQKYRHISEDLIDKIPGMISGAIGQLKITQEKMAISAETPVTNPDATFASFNHRFQVSKEEAELVNKAFLLESGSTMYAVVQAYTRAANENGISLDSRYKLQRIGGIILNLLKN